MKRANESGRSSLTPRNHRSRRHASERAERGARNDGRRQVEELGQYYESLADRAKDFLTVIDSQYVYRDVNDAYCRAHAKRREDILGRTVAEVWGEKIFRSVVQQPLERCLAGEEVHYQARFEFPTTGARYFDVSFYPYRDGAVVSHAVVVTRDVTKSRRAEEEVRLLLNLTQAVNESQDFESALKFSLQKICEATGWILGQAWIPSADGQFLHCGPCWHQKIAGLEKLRAIAQRTRWKRGQGLAGHVWGAKEPLWVPRASAETSLSFPLQTGNTRIEALMGIPVLAGDEVVAVLEFCVCEPQSEDERLMGVVSAVSVQLGTLFSRKRSEAALRESEERYRMLIETAKDVIFRLSMDGKIVSLNRAFEAVTGWRREEWIGKDFAPLVHPEDRPLSLSRFEAILRGEAGSQNTYRVRKKSGEYAVGEFTLSAEMERGAAVGVFGIARDVTQRKRAEEALRESEARFRKIVETAEEGIWVLDEKHRTTFVNRKMAETLGYAFHEMIARPFAAFLAGEDQIEWKKTLEQSHPEGKEHSDLCFLRKDGSEMWALLAWSPVFDREKRYAGALAMISDITERKRAEEALRQSEEHYRELFHQAYRMQENLRNLSDRILEVQEEERTRISRELHDEVGQALTAASVNLAVLKKELPGENERLLKRISDSQSLLSQTMETVHGFARELRPAMLDDLGLLAALRSYVAAFSERTGIRIHFHATAPMALEKLDSAQKTVIYRVAQESLNNIAKHAGASQVHITIKKPNHHLTVEIIDNGKGFAVDPRASNKPCKRLGLLGMQERVRLVKGDFAVESEPGKGTLVRVQIPLTPSEAKTNLAQTTAGIFAAPDYISGRGTSRLQSGF